MPQAGVGAIGDRARSGGPARERRRQRGASLLEYVVLIGLVTVGVLATVRGFGDTVRRLVLCQAATVGRLGEAGGDDGCGRAGGEVGQAAGAVRSGAPVPPPKEDKKGDEKPGDGKPRPEVVDELVKRMKAGSNMSLEEINGGKTKDGLTFSKDELGEALKKFYAAVLEEKGPELDKAHKEARAKERAEEEKRRSKERVKAELKKVSLELAKELVSKGGSATQEDVDVVVDELAKLPPAVLQIAKENKVKVVVARTSVTDYVTELKGVKPRGWPPGSTWDTVPGLQHDKGGSPEVVVATMAGAGGKRVMSNAHGSHSLVLHEFGHAMDEVVKKETGTMGSLHDDFKVARDRDLPHLRDYHKQPGEAGLSEAYAESFAAYYGNKRNMDKDWPALSKFWEKPLQPIIDARKRKK
jgi:Flp pilus assembly pilin Flp